MSLNRLMQEHHRWMETALNQAMEAFEAGEVPVGAVVVQGNNAVAEARNRVEERGDPTAHAERLALQAACELLGTKHLTDCTLYVTLEPCPMCAGALVLARVRRLVFGAFDEKSGAASTLYSIPQDDRLNHQVEILSGVGSSKSAALLKRFFDQRRTD